MVISTLMSRKIILFFLLIGMISGVSADYYYGNSGSNSITGDTGFSVPEYESQRELATKLIAPFLFVTILLQVLFERALRFAFVDEDQNRDMLSLVSNNNPPSVRKESTLMALAAAGILIPSPFWGYVRFATASIPTIAISVIVIGFLYWAYKFLSAL